MHPTVRELYKRVMHVARDYPGGAAYVRPRAKEMFLANAHLESEDEIAHAVARGRWYVRNEMVALIKLKKYRTIRARYAPPEDG